MKRWRIVPIVTAGVLLLIGGCNTMQGIGRDIEAVGNAIQRSTR